MTDKLCCIDGCEKEMTVPSTGTCKNCYQSILNWSKRNPADILKRAQQIGLYSTRMNIVTPKNVAVMRPKKIKLKAMPGQIKYKEPPSSPYKKLKKA